ncbi:putative inner membrane protein, partial [Salmonella enterica subsp. enterica serovar Tennessee str. TXSC_TXSC08-21]
YSLPGEPSSSTCDARNFIGNVDENDFAEYIKKVELTRYSMYCLKKTGAGQWSIYAN